MCQRYQQNDDGVLGDVHAMSDAISEAERWLDNRECLRISPLVGKQARTSDHLGEIAFRGALVATRFGRAPVVSDACDGFALSSAGCFMQGPACHMELHSMSQIVQLSVQYGEFGLSTPAVHDVLAPRLFKQL